MAPQGSERCAQALNSASGGPATRPERGSREGAKTPPPRSAMRHAHECACTVIASCASASGCVPDSAHSEHVHDKQQLRIAQACYAPHAIAAHRMCSSCSNVRRLQGAQERCPGRRQRA